MEKNLSVGALLDVYGFFLSEKQRRIMVCYFDDDLSLTEIAENEGTTRQAVSDIIRRGEAQLMKYESECGYQKKLSDLRKICGLDIGEKEKIALISAVIENF